MKRKLPNRAVLPSQFDFVTFCYAGLGTKMQSIDSARKSIDFQRTVEKLRQGATHAYVEAQALDEVHVVCGFHETTRCR